jgi:anti-sigma regulatory factor (Ser/Thr protein kinase)
VAWRVAQQLQPGVRSGGVARSFCTRRLISVLDDNGAANDVVADVATIAHELVLNAVNAGARAVDLHLALLPDRVRLEVGDDAPGMPELQPRNPDALRGRGLQIVAALSEEWGVATWDSGRKAVWAEVKVPQRRAAVS